VLYISTKAQAWYMDFAIGLLLFSFTLAIYFGYTNNFQKQESGDLDFLLKDAKAISSSLALSGYPNDWDASTVVRIGVSDDQRLNSTKLKSFKLLNYSRTKSSLGTTYEYFVHFVNQDEEVLNVDSVCGVGHSLINTSYNIKSAYYYSDIADSFLKDFMETTFKADIYFGDNPGDLDDIDSLKTNISKYGFLVMEHASLSTSNYNDVKDEINNFSSSGNIFMISGQLTSAQGKELVGVDFFKKSGQSISDRNSTVNNTDQHLTLTKDENIVFAQAYYVENESEAIGFKQIATFNKDGKNAISNWKYGNGSVYSFSDFDVSFFNGDFVNMIEAAAKGIVGGTCNPINITSLNLKNLVKTERYLNYNSDIVKMIVYIWQ
tara:strand:- start:12068 stop:13198 length:1131 start_codon:yes stop_codon:yes gene_type:complete